MSKINIALNSLSRTSGDGFISLEFFPPKTDCGFKNLIARIERMSVLNPLFVSVTWGAGGSTSDRSLELAIYCQKELNLNTCLHLTCTNTKKEIIDSALSRAKEAGIRNILALRGDPPRAEILEEDLNALSLSLDDKSDEVEFNYAVDLVRYIKKEYGDYFAVGVAAYPDGHVDGSDNSNQNFESDLPYLVEKVEAGADFIITQLFFSVDQYLKFEKKALEYEVLRNVPIIPGLIPINNYQLFQRVSKLSHASIPKSILNSFPFSIQSDDRKVKEIGIDVLNLIIEEFVAKSQSKTKGIHFYSLNLESSIAKLVSKSEILQKYANVEGTRANHHQQGATGLLLEHIISESKPSKSPSPSPVVVENKLADDRFASDKHQLRKLLDTKSGSQRLSRKDILAISTGVGTLGKEATWDEFPNGRFGDSRSPAYGEIDGYGPSLKVPLGVQDPIEELWGAPQSLDDIATLFIDYLSKKIPALPFSDLEINAETLLIQEELFDINSKHWFSLSSQPSLNGCDSTDSVFGWGSRNGYLYQKSYIELLVSSSDWESKLKPAINRYNKLSSDQQEASLNNEISYYAAKAGKVVDKASGNTKHAGFHTNICPNNRATAVTWGVFPNKEIVQTTIIEEESFKAWKDEAFKILQEWANLYLIKYNNNKSKKDISIQDDNCKLKNSYKLIKNIHDNFYLVTLFNNNFQDEDALWRFLLQ